MNIFNYFNDLTDEETPKLNKSQHSSSNMSDIDLKMEEKLKAGEEQLEVELEELPLSEGRSDEEPIEWNLDVDNIITQSKAQNIEDLFNQNSAFDEKQD